MRKAIRPPLVAVLLLLLSIASSSAFEVSGYMEAEARLFGRRAEHPGQRAHNASFALAPEFYHQWENGPAVTFVPFARLDSGDPERTHFDVRELSALFVGDAWELRVGAGKVFWGVTEFVHLVDIINQTDTVEATDGEEKLGQPMAHLSLPREWGVVDLFVLPLFRERTFPGEKGRLRAIWPVDTDHPEYESGKEAHHTDLALRYSHTLGIADFGIYHFRGTGREPILIPDPQGERLIPFYEQIGQTGLDLQLTEGAWLMKLEALYRTGKTDDFFAATGGFEYTFTGLAGTYADLGVILEFAWDERGEGAPTTFENDLMFGLRLALNDMGSSEILLGMSQDLNEESRIVSLEASRRFGDRWKAVLESGLFLDLSRNDFLYDTRNDDYLRLQLLRYF